MPHHLVKSVLIPEVVRLIAEKEHISEEQALDKFYSSGIAKAMDDDATGLYGDSIPYIFSLYEEEQQTNMPYYAHSPKPEKNIPPQTYADHINGVYERSCAAARAVLPFAKKDGELLLRSVERAALLHDLGKLDPANQEILSGRKKAKKLTMRHADAGAAYFLNDN
jgi:hypothetical protein